MEQGIHLRALHKKTHATLSSVCEYIVKLYYQIWVDSLINSEVVTNVCLKTARGLIYFSSVHDKYRI